MYNVPMENRTQRFATHYVRRFGASLKNIRTHARLTQSELADRMTSVGYPMSRVMVAKTESATRPVSVEEMAAFASVLEVPVPYLLPSAMNETAAVATRDALQASRLTTEWSIASLLGIVEELQEESSRTQMRIEVLEGEISGVDPEEG